MGILMGFLLSLFYYFITIVNIADLGTCIFWDLLRLVSPTHVIHLHGDHQEPGFQSYWFCEELLPFNITNCHHSPGWLLTPPNSCDQPCPPDSFDQPHPPTGETLRQRGSHIRQIDSPEMTEHSTNSEIVPSAIPETWVTTAKQGRKTLLRRFQPKRLCNKRKRIVKVAQPSLSKGKAVSRKFLHRAKLRADLSMGLFRARRQTHRRHSKAAQNTGWRRCGVFQLFSHLTNPYAAQIR